MAVIAGRGTGLARYGLGAIDNSFGYNHFLQQHQLDKY